jgi:hypothetical protein
MLNKDICKKCYKKKRWYFNSDVENDWENIKIIRCNMETKEDFWRYISILCPPPQYCPYRLEHILNAE